MGKIQIVGIIDDSFSFGNTVLSSKSVILENIVDNMNILNQFLFCLPIILLILIPFILKQKKYGMFNREYREKAQREFIKKNNLDTVGKQVIFVMKRYILIVFLFLFLFYFIVTPIHELIHAVTGALFGAEMKVGFIPQMLVTVAITGTPLSKLQYLLILCMPVILIGIIPAVIVLIKFPKKIKNATKVSILIIFFLAIIVSAGADLISIYNMIKQVPNGAMMQQTDNGMYWYMPENNN